MILVATDGAEQALPATRVALDLASGTGDTVLFVTAWRELRADFGVPLAVRLRRRPSLRALPVLVVRMPASEAARSLAEAS